MNNNLKKILYVLVPILFLSFSNLYAEQFCFPEGCMETSSGNLGGISLVDEVNAIKTAIISQNQSINLNGFTGQASYVTSCSQGSCTNIVKFSNGNITQLDCNNGGWGMTFKYNNFCSNGAINPSLCTVCPSGTSMINGICSNFSSGTDVANSCVNNISQNSFKVTCNGSGQTCDSFFSTNLFLNSTSKINFTTGNYHCSPVQADIYVDGNKINSSYLAGKGIATGYLNAGQVSPGNHLVQVRAIGVQSGCNYGTLKVWGGTLSVTDSLNQTCLNNNEQMCTLTNLCGQQVQGIMINGICSPGSGSNSINNSCISFNLNSSNVSPGGAVDFSWKIAGLNKDVGSRCGFVDLTTPVPRPIPGLQNLDPNTDRVRISNVQVTTRFCLVCQFYNLINQASLGDAALHQWVRVVRIGEN